MKLPKRIVVDFIDSKDHRYDTIGDYWQEGDTWIFKVTNFKNDPNFSIIVLLHELIESSLAKIRGISWKAIDKFDMNYKGEYGQVGEDPAAPYYNEHKFSTKIHRMIKKEMSKKY